MDAADKARVSHCGYIREFDFSVRWRAYHHLQLEGRHKN